MKTLSMIAAGTTALCLLAAPVLAQSQGDWTIGVGVGNVNPKSNNGALAGGAALVERCLRGNDQAPATDTVPELSLPNRQQLYALRRYRHQLHRVFR